MSSLNGGRAADVDTQVAAVRARIAAAQRARARAEHERDAATAQANTAREQLHREYGVTTVEDAKAELARLKTQLADQIAAASDALDEAGA